MDTILKSTAALFCGAAILLNAEEIPVLFQHNFTHGWTKADTEKFEKTVIWRLSGSAPTAVPGATEKKTAMRLAPKGQCMLLNARPKMPGAIFLKVRPSGTLTAKPNRYFGTTNRPGPYLFYQESIVLNAPFAHYGSHNLLAPMENQYNITKQKVSATADQWNVIVVNLKPDGIEFWLNGTKYAGKTAVFEKGKNDQYGDFVIGSMNNTYQIDIAELAIYDRALTDAEITALK